MQPKPPSWDLLMRAVPFAICFDRELRIVHVGETLSRIAADVQVGKLLPDVLSISPASLGWKFDTLAGQAGHFLVLTTHDGHLRLRGSVQALPQPEYLWLMLAPVVLDAADLQKAGLSLSDLPPNEGVADVVTLLAAHRRLLRDAQAITGVLEVARDQEARTKRELEVALDASRSVIHLKNCFISALSHEFRNPLSVVLNTAELMLMRAERVDSEQVRSYGGRILNAGEELQMLLDDILFYLRSSEGKERPSMHTFVLSRFMEETIEQLKRTMQIVQNIQLSPPCPGCREAQIESDDRLLRLVLRNLISNAAKYSGPETEIVIRMEVRADRVEIDVIDSGQGIPAEDYRSIFELFERGEAVSHVQGFGLGLSIVKQCMTLLGGKLEVDSKVGKGTIMRVVLPAHVRCERVSG